MHLYVVTSRMSNDPKNYKEKNEISRLRAGFRHSSYGFDTLSIFQIITKLDANDTYE